LLEDINEDEVVVDDELDAADLLEDIHEDEVVVDDELDAVDLLVDIDEYKVLRMLLLVLELEVEATVILVHLMLCQVPLLSPYSYWEHGFMLVIFTLLT
jgi:hypothetical protein